jgi:uncharacterized iron-regulated protein
MKKLTYVAAIENAINNNMTDETVERLNELKASLEKRAERAKSYDRKPSKATQENAEVKAQIVAWMKEFAVEPLTSAEIAEGMGLEVRKVRGLIGRCEGIEAVRINSKLTKWKVQG